MTRLYSAVGAAAAAFLLFGCDEDSPETVPVVSSIVVSPVPSPSPSPSPTESSAHLHVEPPPAGWVLSPTATGMPHIASSFDPALGMKPSWGSGAIAPSAAPDSVGAFRMSCGAGDLAYVDPIVYPGTVGVSHLHQFYGLTNVSPSETYESARAGNRFSTCGVQDYSLNKSLYWLPSLLDGRGSVIQPNLVSVYYKRRPKTDTKCNWNIDPQGQAEECVNMPQGLRLVGGAVMSDGEALANKTVPGGGFYCHGPNGQSPKSDNLEVVLAHSACQGDVKLEVVMDFANCWDGKHLDSPDHRSHLAKGSYGSWGYLKCPATHPKLIPTIHIAASYSLAISDDRALIRLSSDMLPGVPRGKTLHGDFMPAWDPVAWKMFHDNCIDKLLNCSGGDLGNGLQLKGASQPSYGWTNPTRLLSTSAIP